MAEVKIHGTYPYDDFGEGYKPCWKRLRELSLEEAATLTKTPLAAACGEEGDVYLWLNKGYIVLGVGEQLSKLTSGCVARVEGFFRFSWRIPAGAQAVYLHDGKYSLIERTGVAQTRREG